MTYVLEDLVINRVDLVDEGANSAAFIELYKRKEQTEMPLSEILSKMKPEHAAIIQEAIDEAAEKLKEAQEALVTVTTERDQATQERDTANEALAGAKEELEALKAAEGDKEGGCKSQAGSTFDETETMKSMPTEVREMFEKMKAQRDAAEEEVRKAKEAEQTATAFAKANELKAIPVEQEKLVGIIKGASPDLLDLLTVVNAAIEGTVLDEVGKSHVEGTNDAWAKIESKADEVAKRDNITKAKAISQVIKEKPELYKEYLQGGAN